MPVTVWLPGGQDLPVQNMEAGRRAARSLRLALRGPMEDDMHLSVQASLT